MGEELLPNFTFFIELGLFFVCYFMLRTFVFGPYLELLEMRRAKTIGLKEKAATDRERAEKLKADYETFMKAERRKVSAWTDEERKKVHEEEKKVVQDAREKVNAELKVVREKLHQDTEQARKELLPHVAEYSSQMVSKLVGRSVKVSTNSHVARNAAETSVPG